MTHWEVCGEAKDGAEAIQKAAELLPNLILLDVSMPGLNGLEAARLLREKLPAANAKISPWPRPSVLYFAKKEISCKQSMERSAFPRRSPIKVRDMTQAEKGRTFRALHERDRAFIIPNPWDAGTARLLAHLGFEALATTSAGYAFSVGRRDNTIDRDEIIAHVAAIVSATDLPVSADLENGFGDAPESRTKPSDGGGRGSGRRLHRRHVSPARPSHLPAEHAADRIRAAAQAARALPFPFTLTARAENYLVGRPD